MLEYKHSIIELNRAMQETPTLTLVFIFFLLIAVIGLPIIWIIRKNRKKQLVGPEAGKAVVLAMIWIMLGFIPIVFLVESIPRVQDRLITALTNETLGDAADIVTAGEKILASEIEEQIGLDGVTDFTQVTSYDNTNRILRDQGTADRYYLFKATDVDNRYLVMRVELNSLANFTAPGTNGITELFYGNGTKTKAFLAEQGHEANF